MSQRAVDPVKNSVEDDPLAGLPEDAAARVRRFVETSHSIGCDPAFRGSMLMALLIYADDYAVDLAIETALDTIGLGRTQ